LKTQRCRCDETKALKIREKKTCRQKFDVKQRGQKVFKRENKSGLMLMNMFVNMKPTVMKKKTGQSIKESRNGGW